MNHACDCHVDMPVVRRNPLFGRLAFQIKEKKRKKEENPLFYSLFVNSKEEEVRGRVPYPVLIHARFKQVVQPLPY